MQTTVGPLGIATEACYCDKFRKAVTELAATETSAFPTAACAIAHRESAGEGGGRQHERQRLPSPLLPPQLAKKTVAPRSVK